MPVVTTHHISELNAIEKLNERCIIFNLVLNGKALPPVLIKTAGVFEFPERLVVFFSSKLVTINLFFINNIKKICVKK